jgi:hypothetical protein
MTRTMFDAVTPGNLPRGARIVAGYSDGLYSNMKEIDAAFPSAIHVDIAVSSNFDGGHVLDVERGDALPGNAPGWVVRRRNNGIDPSVYCDASTWPSVRAAFHSQGIAEPHYWIAQYDGDPTIPPGAVAKQYASNAAYDTSSVADYWPGIDPAPEVHMPLTPEDITLLLTTRIPEAVLPNGYVPTIQDCLNGSKTADTQIAALDLAVKTVATEAAAQKLVVDSIGAQATANGIALSKILTHLGIA